jgi:hypothetical protein
MKTENKLTARAAAGLLGAAAGNWGRGSTNKSLDKVYKADRRQLMAIRSALAVGRIKTAFRMANRLDTIVRDVIPTNVYEFMSEKAGAS